MADKDAAPERRAVDVVTTSSGANQYRIVASATFDTEPAGVWELLWDWERFLAVGLPGQTSAFKWLSGGPDKVPSTFEFVVAGVTVREEIYERVEGTAGRYRLRYKTLEPALGILEYDAVLELQGLAEGQTSFSATRDVRLAAGSTPDMLAGMVESETQCLKEHFGR
ncbi:MAG: SRPBCC family protein [Vicinamibacterales bacterium]